MGVYILEEENIRRELTLVIPAWIRFILERLLKKNHCPPGTVCVGDTANLFIGINVSFGGNVLLYANAPIEIGDHTIIGINATLHTTTHDYRDHPMYKNRIDRPIKIGQHAWIGTGAIILAGVIIEDYAVVGAGSIVNARVPRGAIVAGNPARIIGYRPDEVYQLIPTEERYIIRQGYVEKYCRERGVDDT
jgi:acetyltransferase-like isoleucine patch superfamily enzyme